MKYYFVSDLHACDPLLLLQTLEDKQFDMEKDTLVILGDLLDRGDFAAQLLDFVLEIPNKIIVLGNHDVRLQQLILRTDKPNQYDVNNGVGMTFKSFAGMAVPGKHESLSSLLNYHIPNSPHGKEYINKFLQYIKDGVWAIEFSNLIATHGWVPHFYTNDRRLKLAYMWRMSSDASWYDATWAQTLNCLAAKIYPDKPLLVGHYNTFALRARFEYHMDETEYLLSGLANFNTYVRDTVTCIDGCAVYSRQINVYIYESDEEPILYRRKNV